MDKEQLKEYRWISENIKELEDRLLEIDSKLQRITTNLEADKVQTTKSNDHWTALIQSRMEINDLINAEITRGLKQMALIEKVISNLPEREKLLMRYRYINGKRWEEICYLMGYEWAQIHRVHARILENMR